MIAKLATRNFHADGSPKLDQLTSDPNTAKYTNSKLMEAAKSAAEQFQVTCSLETFCFQIYIEVELVHSDDSRGTKLFTGTLYGYELG